MALVREMFETLENRERAILMMCFGLDNQPPKTLGEVGKEFGVTRERIRQVQELALEKRRTAMENRDVASLRNGTGQTFSALSTVFTSECKATLAKRSSRVIRTRSKAEALHQ